jgi:hypothetical protein
VVAALVLAAAAACNGSQPTTAPPATQLPGVVDNAESEVPVASPTASASPNPSPRPTRSPSPRPKPTPSRTPTRAAAATPKVMSTYGISFTMASGGTSITGRSGGVLKRYMVAVEKGLSESPASVAATVDKILGNQTRGWARGGAFRFQRVSGGSYDFVVELATPKTTDFICGKYGLDTGGVVSCRGQKNVVINLDRWRTGTNGTTVGAIAYAPADYRVLVINHEVGHALGKAHVGCPGAGKPAPVMMTQYYGLDGCTKNIWPYSSGGTYLTGPPPT